MNQSNIIKFEPSEARKALNLLYREDDVVELRIPKSKRGTISGYFNDMEKLIVAAAEYSGEVPGIYITPNPVNPQLLARANNRLERYANWTTSDADILCRRWLAIDVDAVRAAGISQQKKNINWLSREAYKLGTTFGNSWAGLSRF